MILLRAGVNESIHARHEHGRFPHSRSFSCFKASDRNSPWQCISAVTKGEIAFGLKRRPADQALCTVVTEFLRRVDVLPWDSEVTDTYRAMRAELERLGKTLGALDMMIGAHALSLGAVLISNEQAFRSVPGLNLEDWTRN